MRNPEAVKAMEDLEFLDIRETTIDDVVNSRMIADPLHLLECCMISDGGGAVVIASAEVARICKKPPVWILGSGEATKYPENSGDITTSAAAQSGPVAFGEAGVTPAEMDIDDLRFLQHYCARTARRSGLLQKGEGGSWVEGGKLHRPVVRHSIPTAVVCLRSPRYARHFLADRSCQTTRRIHLTGRWRQTCGGSRQRRYVGQQTLPAQSF